MPTYTRSDLKNYVWDQYVDPQISSILDINSIMNQSVRQVLGDIDLRSAKRRTAASPNLFENVYDYACPTDLKGLKIIDIIPQLPRPRSMNWTLVSEEEFDRRKSFEKYLVCFRDNDLVRKLRVAVPHGGDFADMTISPLDTLTSGGGTWALKGDATNLRADGVNFIEGAGSILWDIGAGGTGVAGIQNSSLNVFDITDYATQGSIFVWVYMIQTTNVTSFSLEIGTDSSNYYKKTVTTDSAGNAFVTGWNLLRFDLASSTETGTVTDDDCAYVAIYMNSSAAITNVANWRFDMVRAQIGRFYDVLYYSKYGWQSSSGTYKENSTADTDYLNVDAEELELITLKTEMNQAQILKDWDTYKTASQEYADKKKSYMSQYPSEALMLTQTHYDFMKIIDTERDDSRSDRFFT